ncbi:unnamed protein product, partial [Larinioides sclopetarius]
KSLSCTPTANDIPTGERFPGSSLHNTNGPLSPKMTRLAEQSLVVFCCVTCICLIAEAIDCRKFVFAPRCRGVSAKRSAKLNNEDLRELGDIDDTWMDWPRPSQDEIPDSSFESRRKTILQKLLEKFNDYSLRDEDN